MDKYNFELPGSSSGETGRGSITFIGTATTLIRLGAFTLLTDPNFLHKGDHVHLGYGLTSERLTNPAMEIDDLPDLDLCVLSHYHDDHWDRVASAHLPKDLPVVTTDQAAKTIEAEGFTQGLALDTWESCFFRRGDEWLRITSLPGRHGPPIVDFALPDVMGSLIEWGRQEGSPSLHMYISGDTLVYDDLKEIPQRYPQIDLALLHLGGTRAMGVLVSMDAEQGVEIIQILQPQEVIPIHYNDYTVFKSPLEDFLQKAEQAGLGSRIHVLKHGQTFDFQLVER